MAEKPSSNDSRGLFIRQGERKHCPEIQSGLSGNKTCCMLPACTRRLPFPVRPKPRLSGLPKERKTGNGKTVCMKLPVLFDRLYRAGKPFSAGLPARHDFSPPFAANGFFRPGDPAIVPALCLFLPGMAGDKALRRKTAAGKGFPAGKPAWTFPSKVPGPGICPANALTPA